MHAYVEAHEQRRQQGVGERERWQPQQQPGLRDARQLARASALRQRGRRAVARAMVRRYAPASELCDGVHLPLTSHMDSARSCWSSLDSSNSAWSSKRPLPSLGASVPSPLAVGCSAGAFRRSSSAVPDVGIAIALLSLATSAPSLASSSSCRSSCAA